MTTHAELAAELIERMDRGQQERSQTRRRDPGDDHRARVREVDTDNTTWLTQILDRHGWPRHSHVGKDAATAAWLLAQHADHDPDFIMARWRENAAQPTVSTPVLGRESLPRGGPGRELVAHGEPDLRRNIGILLLSEGKTTEAVDELRPLHDDLRVVYGPQHDETREVADVLARLRFASG